MNDSIRFQGPATIEAAGDAKQPRRFRVDPAYTGGELRVAAYPKPIVVDLATLKAGRVVANLDHDPSKRVGHVTESANDGRTLSLTGIVSAANAAAVEFIESSESGFPWAASIEARPGEVEEVPPGKSGAVNGRKFQGPVLVARAAVLHGVGFLSHGADEEARAMLATKGSQMRPSFESWIREFGFDAATLTAQQRQNLQDDYDGKPGIRPPLIAAGSGSPLEDEANRVRTIEAIEAPADMVSIRPEFETTVAELKARGIAQGWTANKVEHEIVRASMPQAHTVYGGRPDPKPRMIEAALCQAIGMADLENQFDDQTLQAAHSAFRGRMGLQQILIMAATGNGYRMNPGERVHTGNLRNVLAYALPQPGPREVHAQGWSTLSVPGILSNVANKSLLDGWMEGDQSWREVAQVKPVSDFKQATSYRLLDNSEYDELPKGGEINHGTLTEQSYTRQIATYAKMYAITRQDIINDDLGAFNDLRTRVGRGAIQKFNNVFWARFINNATFFASGNSNVISGGSSTLLTDGVGLQAAVLKFRQLVSADGKRLDGEPVLLLVPPEVEFAARRLYQSTNFAGGSTSVVEGNPFEGLYKPVIQTRLSDSAFTGFSTTAWYLLRSPAIAAVIVASFLNGNQSPTVESADSDFNTLGIQFRGYHDFGADLTIDYQAGIRSAGA